MESPRILLTLFYRIGPFRVSDLLAYFTQKFLAWQAEFVGTVFVLGFWITHKLIVYINIFFFFNYLLVLYGGPTVFK